MICSQYVYTYAPYDECLPTPEVSRAGLLGEVTWHRFGRRRGFFCILLVRHSKALVTTSKALVTTSKALVTTSVALVTSNKKLTSWVCGMMWFYMMNDVWKCSYADADVG